MILRRRWFWVALVAAVVAGTAAVSTLSGLGGEGTFGDVPYFEVRRGEFVRKVYAEGNLEAAEATVLGAPSTVRGGLKIGWLAPDGSRVSEGEVVIRFDPTEIEKKLADGQNQQATTDSRISQKRVREDAALRNLGRDADMAEMDLGFAKEFQTTDDTIFSRNEIIESEIDEELATERKTHAEDLREIRTDLAEVEIDLLGIERRKADLQVEEAETELDDLEVEAPHDGIFVLKGRWGRIPEVGQSVWSGNPIAELPQMDLMEAKVYVLEADAGGLEKDIPAKLILDAHPDRVIDAKVKQVDRLAQPRNWRVPVQYFGVVLELEETDTEVMKPGQRVQATLIVDQLEDVISIPRQAVFVEDGKKIVYVGRGGRFEPVEVELGSAGLGLVVVESGLEEGDRVALRDPTRPLRAPAGEGEGGENGVATASTGGGA